MSELQKLVSKLNYTWPAPNSEILLKHGELNIEVMNGEVETIDGYTKTEFMQEAEKATKGIK